LYLILNFKFDLTFNWFETAYKFFNHLFLNITYFIVLWITVIYNRKHLGCYRSRLIRFCARYHWICWQ